MIEFINFEGIDNQNMRILYLSFMILALIGVIITFIRMLRILDKEAEIGKRKDEDIQRLKRKGFHTAEIMKVLKFKYASQFIVLVIYFLGLFFYQFNVNDWFILVALAFLLLIKIYEYYIGKSSMYKVKEK